MRVIIAGSRSLCDPQTTFAAIQEAIDGTSPGSTHMLKVAKNFKLKTFVKLVVQVGATVP